MYVTFKLFVSVLCHCVCRRAVQACQQNLQQCVMPLVAQFHGMSPEVLREQILEHGLEDTCRYRLYETGSNGS